VLHNRLDKSINSPAIIFCFKDYGTFLEISSEAFEISNGIFILKFVPVAIGAKLMGPRLFQMHRRSARKRTPSARLSRKTALAAKSASQMLRSTKPAEDGPITQDQSIITCSAAPSTSNAIADTKY
jgi:hypothetical protein